MERACGEQILQLTKIAGSEECLHYQHHRRTQSVMENVCVMSPVDHIEINVNSS